MHVYRLLEVLFCENTLAYSDINQDDIATDTLEKQSASLDIKDCKTYRNSFVCEVSNNGYYSSEYAYSGTSCLHDLTSSVSCINSLYFDGDMCNLNTDRSQQRKWSR